MPAADVPDEPAGGGVDVPRGLRIAVGLVLLQAVALFAGAVLLAVKAGVDHPANVAAALLVAAFALLGSAVLVLCARGLAALRPAARTPVLVFEVLAVVVSFSLGIQAGRIAIGGPILVVSAAVGYLLLTPPVRAVLDRDY